MGVGRAPAAVKRAAGACHCALRVVWLTLMLRASELPTVPPPFDAERYAKDSDARLVAASASGSWLSVERELALEQERELAPDEAGSATPQSETRLVARAAGAFTDEGWARTAIGKLVVAVSLEQLKEMPLDHRAGYLLSWMDGSIDLDTLVDVSTMSRPEVLRIVRELYDSGVIEVR